jgi:predicted amidohydrolase
MSLHVSAIQLEFQYAATPQEFFDRISAPVERAAQAGAQLVALPNYTGLMLLGIAKPAAKETESLGEIARADEHETVADMLRSVAPVMRNFYLHLFESLARRSRVYLAPGTIIESDGDNLYNTAFLFAPDGKVVGMQRQTHRAPHEVAWGLAQGEELNVFDIGAARVGFVVGEDVEYPEVARILALQGANLLVHPAAYAAWNDANFLLDVWREAQSNQVFGLQACIVARSRRRAQTKGRRADDHAQNGRDYKGKSAIYAPVELTPDHRGILARAARADAEEIVSAPLDFDALQKTVNANSIFNHFNHDLYMHEFPIIYRSGAA